MPGYFSELRYAGDIGSDFIEVAVPKGTDVSGYTIQVYEDPPGPTDYSLSATYTFGTSTQTVDQKDVYVFDSGTTGWEGISHTSAIAIVDDLGNVVQFVSFGQTVTPVDGDAAGLTSTNIGGGDQEDGQSLQSDNDGISYYTQNSPNSGTIPCFTPGTLILTPRGEMLVEDLTVGDLVITKDHGKKPIRYLARSEVRGPQIPENRQPILIPCGSLGPGLPKRDLLVSGQHRMLLAWPEVRKIHDAAEVLAPAKGLVPLLGARVKRGLRHVDYIHLLLDRHEVLFAEGAPTESFYPGPAMLRDMNRSNRQALFHAVPELRDGVEAAIGEPARKLLRVQETNELVRIYKKRLKDEIAKWNIDLAMERYEAERLAASGSQATALDRAVAQNQRLS